MGAGMGKRLNDKAKGRFCAVFNCSNSQGMKTAEGVLCNHFFVMSDDRRDTWWPQLDRGGSCPANVSVCDVHFLDEQIVKSDLRWDLVDGALPLLLLDGTSPTEQQFWQDGNAVRAYKKFKDANDRARRNKKRTAERERQQQELLSQQLRESTEREEIEKAILMEDARRKEQAIVESNEYQTLLERGKCVMALLNERTAQLAAEKAKNSRLQLNTRNMERKLARRDQRIKFLQRELEDIRNAVGKRCSGLKKILLSKNTAGKAEQIVAFFEAEGLVTEKQHSMMKALLLRGMEPVTESDDGKQQSHILGDVEFSPADIDLGYVLHFHSPQAYRELLRRMRLPSETKLKELVGRYKIEPGQFIPCGIDRATLRCRESGFFNVGIIIDGMAISTQEQMYSNTTYSKVKTQGLADYEIEKENVRTNKKSKVSKMSGGKGNETKEKRCENDNRLVAKTMVAVMLVGLQEPWKVLVGYFMVDTETGLLGQHILQDVEKLVSAAGMVPLTVTLDGTNHNITTYENLGANLSGVSHLDEIVHTIEVNGRTMFVWQDPCHMLKNIRNALAAYGKFDWPEQGGCVDYYWLLKLVEFQSDEHDGLRSGNKLDAKTVYFVDNVMKVNLAAKLFSESTAESLEYMYDNVPGWRCADVKVTATFIRLVNDAFDILNSMQKYNSKSPFKGAIHFNGYERSNQDTIFSRIKEIEDCFSQIRTSNNTHTTGWGNKKKKAMPRSGTHLISSPRRCGFVGFLACFKTLKSLAEKATARTTLTLPFFCSYRISQDHLEIYFNLVRLRNGWTYNPTQAQAMYAVRHLLVYGERGLIASSNANVTRQDDASFLLAVVQESIIDDLLPIAENDNEVLVQSDSPVTSCGGCPLKDGISCDYCCNCVAYIAGYQVLSILRKKSMHCESCFSCLVDSVEDPVKHRVLIDKKNERQSRFSQFFKDAPPHEEGRESKEQGAGGLVVPSGSVEKICQAAEVATRTVLTGSVADMVTYALDLLVAKNISLFPKWKGLDEDHKCKTRKWQPGQEAHKIRLIKTILTNYMTCIVKDRLKTANNSNKYMRAIVNACSVR